MAHEKKLHRKDCDIIFGIASTNIILVNFVKKYPFTGSQYIYPVVALCAFGSRLAFKLSRDFSGPRVGYSSNGNVSAFLGGSKLACGPMIRTACNSTFSGTRHLSTRLHFLYIRISIYVCSVEQWLQFLLFNMTSNRLNV